MIHPFLFLLTEISQAWRLRRKGRINPEPTRTLAAHYYIEGYVRHDLEVDTTHTFGIRKYDGHNWVFGIVKNGVIHPMYNYNDVPFVLWTNGWVFYEVLDLADMPYGQAPEHTIEATISLPIQPSPPPSPPLSPPSSAPPSPSYHHHK